MKLYALLFLSMNCYVTAGDFFNFDIITSQPNFYARPKKILPVRRYRDAQELKYQARKKEKKWHRQDMNSAQYPKPVVKNQNHIFCCTDRAQRVPIK